MITNEETNAYKRVRAFIKQGGYNFLVGDVVIGYYKRLEGVENSDAMNHCIDGCLVDLEEDLKELMVRY